MKKRLLKILVSMLLIFTVGVMPIAAQATTPVYIMKVVAQMPRLRNKPGVAGDVIGKLRYGEKLLLVKTNKDGWCSVVTTSGKRGYVYGQYLKKYGALPRNRVGYIKDGKSVYARVGGQYRKIATYKEGALVYVLQTNNGWARVKLLNGKICYTQTKSLRKLS